MLDTIALTLDRTQFQILEPERFSPSATGLLSSPFYPLGARGNFLCVQNPTKTDFDAGRYLPRLTLAKRKSHIGFALTLRIEFSAPKLIFGNNFDELISRDFESVVEVLGRRLGEMGVRVTEDTLRGAKVSAIHYSKNIAFTDYTTCTMVMRDLTKIDLPMRLDLSHTDYRNDGHAIRYHANSYEVTFYDKMKDLQKARYSERRAIERDNHGQIDLFRDRAFPKQLEVLRMEVRLGNRTKIKGVMKQIGADVEPTFAGLFDISIAEDVLKHFWDNVRRQLVLTRPSATPKAEDVLQELLRSGRQHARLGKLLQEVALTMLVQSVGPRGLQALLARRCNPRTWQRIKRGLHDLPGKEAGGFIALKHVDEALREFRPIQMNNYSTG
jgi:hypothetical protein